SFETSIGAAASNTSQTASARRNTAAGVAPANGKVSRSPSPTCTTSTRTGDFGSRGGVALTAGVTDAGGSALAGAGGSLPLEATAPAGGAAGWIGRSADLGVGAGLGTGAPSAAILGGAEVGPGVAETGRLMFARAARSAGTSFGSAVSTSTMKLLSSRNVRTSGPSVKSNWTAVFPAPGRAAIVATPGGGAVCASARSKRNDASNRTMSLSLVRSVVTAVACGNPKT